MYIYNPFQEMLAIYFGSKWSLEDFDGIFMRALNYFVIVMVMLHGTLKTLLAKGCSALVMLTAVTAERN